jgi:hypothetical protein
MSRSSSFTFLTLAAVALPAAGCRKPAPPAPQEGAPASVTSLTGAGAAAPPSDARVASRIVGTWASADGSDVLEITPTTLRHRYKNIPGDRAAAINYEVLKDERGGVLLGTHIETPNGKKVAMDPQAFELVDESTLKGGNAKTKKYTTYTRSK